MMLLLALALGPAETWQDAYRAELADPTTATQLPAQQGEIEWFARANQQRHFDETLTSALFSDERGDVMLACTVPNAVQDLRYRQASARVEASLECGDRAECGELARAVHEMRGACLDLAVWNSASMMVSPTSEATVASR